MERMKVLLVKPMESPRVVEIPHTVEAMQELVGGTIACTYPWDDLVGLVHADDGIALGYPLNRAIADEDGNIYDIVPGTFFICGLTEDSFTDIPDGLAGKYTELFRYPELYMRTLSGKVLRFRIGSGEPPEEL